MIHDCHQFEAAHKALANTGNFSQSEAGSSENRSIHIIHEVSSPSEYARKWVSIKDKRHHQKLKVSLDLPSLKTILLGHRNFCDLGCQVDKDQFIYI